MLTDINLKSNHASKADGKKSILNYATKPTDKV